MKFHPDSIEQLLIAANNMKDEQGNWAGSMAMYRILSTQFLHEYVFPIEDKLQEILNKHREEYQNATKRSEK